MKNIMLFVLIAYVFISSAYIIVLAREWFLPEFANPVDYFQNDRRNKLLEIANYMRARSINSASTALKLSDPALEAMMDRQGIHKIEFMDDGIVVYGVSRGCLSFEYYHGGDIALYINKLNYKFPEHTYFRIDDHWYFVSNRKSK